MAFTNGEKMSKAVREHFILTINASHQYWPGTESIKAILVTMQLISDLKHLASRMDLQYMIDNNIFSRRFGMCHFKLTQPQSWFSPSPQYFLLKSLQVSVCTNNPPVRSPDWFQQDLKEQCKKKCAHELNLKSIILYTESQPCYNQR